MLIPIPSRSRPGLRHQVYVDPRSGRAVCPCEAYTFSKDRPRRCAHSVAALSLTAMSYAYDTEEDQP
jgi:hypothetical protein